VPEFRNGWRTSHTNPCFVLKKIPPPHDILENLYRSRCTSPAPSRLLTSTRTSYQQFQRRQSSFLLSTKDCGIITVTPLSISFGFTEAEAGERGVPMYPILISIENPLHHVAFLRQIQKSLYIELTVLKSSKTLFAESYCLVWRTFHRLACPKKGYFARLLKNYGRSRALLRSKMETHNVGPLSLFSFTEVQPIKYSISYKGSLCSQLFEQV
jgi:hypothetical protein